MAKTTGPTNPITKHLIVQLEKVSKKQNAPLWADIAHRLGKPARRRAAVNVGKIGKVVREGEMALIPGKLLASGNISKPVTVAALSASAEAKAKISTAKGKFLTIEELVKQNPKGSKVRIVK